MKVTETAEGRKQRRRSAAWKLFFLASLIAVACLVNRYSLFKHTGVQNTPAVNESEQPAPATEPVPIEQLAMQPSGVVTQEVQVAEVPQPVLVEDNKMRFTVRVSRPSNTPIVPPRIEDVIAAIEAQRAKQLSK